MSPELSTWLASTGGWIYPFALVIMAVVSVLPVPAEGPAMLNGALFGPAVGTLITWAGALTGAWGSFELSRAYGRPFVERRISPAVLDRIARATEGVGWGGLLTLRLIPLIAFTALNWGLGLTPVSRGRFLWTTAVGIMPGAFLFTGSGAWVAALWRSRGPVPAVLILAAFVLLLLLLIGHGRRVAGPRPDGPRGGSPGSSAGGE